MQPNSKPDLRLSLFELDWGLVYYWFDCTMFHAAELDWGLIYYWF